MGILFFFFFPFIISSSLVMKSCLTLATRWTVARQAPPPTGFSRQEYQSGLPFPSPFRALDSESLLYHITGSVGRVVFILCQEMASSFKTQSACLFSHSVMSSSLQPHGLKPARSPGPWDFPGKNTGLGCHFLLQASLHELVPNLSCCLILVESHSFCPYVALKFHSSTD